MDFKELAKNTILNVEKDIDTRVKYLEGLQKKLVEVNDELDSLEDAEKLLDNNS